MQINREIIKKELDKLIDAIFTLPEVTAVKIRDVVMKKGEERTDKLEEAMEISGTLRKRTACGGGRKHIQ